MELRFEEYCDADLSLIRDYYETTFSTMCRIWQNGFFCGP